MWGKSPHNVWGLKDRYVKLRHTLKFVRFITKNNFRHADTQMVNVGDFGYNSASNQTKGNKMATMLDTTNWVSYPFSVEGVEFLSLLDPKGSFYPQVERLPAGIFTAENVRMVTEFIGNPALMTRSELEDELDRVNAGASQAILALA